MNIKMYFFLFINAKHFKVQLIQNTFYTIQTEIF